MSIEFVKYQGLGNDFILIDNRSSSELIVSPEQAIKLCDRHFGIGADGVIFALPGLQGTDYTMRIINSDGSEPEMCGNGIRCLAGFIADLEENSGKLGGMVSSPQAFQESAKEVQYRIHTLAGVMSPQLMGDGQVKVDMGLPKLLAKEIPTTLSSPEQKVINESLEVAGKNWLVTCVSMGNPHCITFVEDAAAIDLALIGTQFEHHSAFPQKINTEFIKVVRRDRLKMRVWERGAGITLACGTGACAALVAGVLTGKCDRKATVELPGGDLLIEWSEPDQRLYMTGAQERVFAGTID